jgi:hypothetical protein
LNPTNPVSPYYKAIAAFVGSTVSLFVALHLPTGIFTDPNVQAAVASAVAAIIPTAMVYFAPHHPVPSK